MYCARGHNFRLIKQHHTVNCYSNSFVGRTVNAWNALPLLRLTLRVWTVLSIFLTCDLSQFLSQWSIFKGCCKLSVYWPFIPFSNTFIFCVFAANKLVYLRLLAITCIFVQPCSRQAKLMDHNEITTHLAERWTEHLLWAGCHFVVVSHRITVALLNHNSIHYLTSDVFVSKTVMCAVPTAPVPHWSHLPACCVLYDEHQ